MKKFIDFYEIPLVSLSEHWSRKLEPFLGPSKNINNPVHPRFSPQKGVKRVQGKVLVVGRKDPVKGHSFAIDVIRKVREKYPKMYLVMTGIDEHPEPWVNTLGWTSTEDLVNQYRTSQLLLMPSLFEGQPLAAIEAMSCGTQVIVSSSITSLPESAHSIQLELDLWVNKIISLMSSNTKLGQGYDMSEFEIQVVQSQWALLYSSFCV